MGAAFSLQEDICSSIQDAVKVLAWIIETRYDATFILKVGSSLDKTVM